MTKGADLPIHPALTVIPMMNEEELDDLADDIKQYGLNKPVILWRQYVVDGRCRLEGCKRAKVEPRFDRLGDDQDPVAYIVSVNLFRQSLWRWQRALAVAKLGLLDQTRSIPAPDKAMARRVNKVRPGLKLEDAILMGAICEDLDRAEGITRIRLSRPTSSPKKKYQRRRRPTSRLS
jgi:hypothetical protein